MALAIPELMLKRESLIKLASCLHSLRGCPRQEFERLAPGLATDPDRRCRWFGAIVVRAVVGDVRFN